MSKWRRRISGTAAALAALFVLYLIGSAAHLFPQLRNPFGETTTERSQPVVLKSIVELSKYEAASGNFQVVVDVSSSGILPSFLEGSDTMFIGIGSENAYVDFSHLKGDAVKVSADRLTATLTLPHAQLDPAVLDVKQSYVFAQQQGLFTRLNSFLSGNPNSQQAVYELAQKQIEKAAASSAVRADAERNTRAMLVSLLQSLGFKTVTVTFA
ncbi:DUF4230 domain-containing protein [Actinocrinis puniceicyclus]|uniref:DUF4230 domain-containing protein n=1 Tax=Actinocrinis puniceicyclus TaxID=977794 RepID=A0A8J7WS43_9ACTN|nr:DUF4230 domain-containing protein [Actinocrinis puniceicyclus]MBS2964590.1 DUF4230 domain-containing protein [Actinocrinis puniceicyclus]